MIFKSLVLYFVFVSCSAEYEGDSCTNYDGSRGVCVKIGDCPSALVNIQRHREEHKRCGFDKTIPIVCCSDRGQKPVITTTKRSPVQVLSGDEDAPEYVYDELETRSADCQPIPAATANRTGQRAFDQCIQYQEELVYPCKKGVTIYGEPSRRNNCHHKADELIIGGEDADKLEFTHMALLRYGENEENQQWYCGGALISESYVLTAGHCTSTNKGVEVSHVVLGILARSEESKDNRYKVRNIVKHPQYISPHKYNDIALLQITKVKLSEFIVPACLYVGGPVADGQVLATGWGIVDKRGSLADVLQRVILEKFTIAECAQEFIPHRHLLNGIDPKTQSCYGDRSKPADTCSGDSGGPIQIKSKTLHCMYTIVGVTSVGKDCGYIGRPAIYTSILSYVPWIEDVVWPKT